MRFQSEFDVWHSRVQDADPAHDDASSPWYSWVQQVLGELRGLRVLEAACGRGGFIKRLSAAGAETYGLDFSLAALRVAKAKTLDAAASSTSLLGARGCTGTSFHRWTCGMPDVVENDFNGLLVAPADPAAIEEAVLRIAASPDLRERLGRTAQETMTRYIWERSACMLEKLFRHVIDRESTAKGTNA